MRKIRLVTIFVGAALGAGIPLAGCSTSEEQARKAACAELDNLSPEDMDRIFRTAEANLAQAGVQLNVQTWNDPEKFNAYVGEVEKVANCNLELPRFLGHLT